MKTRTTIIITMLSLCLLVSSQTYATDIEDLPGYVDLEWIDIPDDAEEVHDIDLGLVLLGIAAEAEESGNPELADALDLIKSIRVKAFSADAGAPEDHADTIKKIERQLEKDNWSRMIYIRKAEEFVSVNILREDGDLVGLMVIALEDYGSVVFANVVGDLDLSTLFRMAQELEEEDIESIFDHLEKYDDG